MTALAVVCAMACVWLVVPSQGRRLDIQPKTGAWEKKKPWRLAVIAVVAAGLAGLFHPVTAVLGVVVIIGWTAMWMVRARAQERTWVRRSKEVARVGHLLESLLGLGHIPSSALALAAEECPIVAPAVAAHRLGADPCEVLDHLAMTPGQHGLGEIGRAWKVSLVSGGSMHSALQQVRLNLEEEADTISVVAAELAPARSTGQLLAVLPLVGFGLAHAIGADALGFLTGSLLGRAALLAGIALECAGLVWTQTLARKAFQAHTKMERE